MKKYNWLLLIAFAAGLRAADAPKINSTNSPAGSPRQSEATAGTNAPPAAKVEAATIPDATHKPVFTTNTVAIAGRRVTYVAETGMLPILKTDGTSRASVFYVAYTRTGLPRQSEAAAGRPTWPRGPSRSVSMAGPARRPCGCISARSARAA